MSQDREQLITSLEGYTNYESTPTTEGPPICSEATGLNYEPAKKWPQFVATIAATFSSLATGATLAWTSPISDNLIHGKYNNIPVDSNEMGWIGSLLTLGAMLMCFPTGIICDLIGRKTTLLLLIIPFGVGWSFIIWAQSVTMLYIGRFVTGMAAGACCVAAPMYTGEIAQKEIRGALGSFFQLMVSTGVFFAYVVGKIANPVQFTFICASLPFVFFTLIVFQPESPLYSLKKGKIQEAYNALLQLRGRYYDASGEIDAMKAELENSAENSSTFLESLRKTAARKAVIIAFALMFFQQLSGINAVIFYTSDIFAASGIKLDPKIATIIVGGVQAAATVVACFAIERLGRRKLLIFSDLVMAISAVFLGLFFSLKDHKIVDDDVILTLGFIPVVSLCAFVLVYSIGLGPIPWMISSEIFTSEIKSIASAGAGTLNWFLAFLVTKFYLELQLLIGADVMFYIFATVSFVGALFEYCVIPETKGKSIMEIQRELEG